jgi:hypothetical protein
MRSSRVTSSVAVAALLMLAACATSSPGRRFTIRVEDESGQPLVGARIEASLWYDLRVWNLFQGCTMRVLASGETDPGGTFSFTADYPAVSRSFCHGSPVRVSYRDWPDYHAQLETDLRGVLGGKPERLDDRVVHHPDGETALVVRLGPARTVRGTVRWREQPGCEEAPEILAQEFFPGGTVVVRASARVDAGGAFALTGLGTGRLSIVARYCRVTAEREVDLRSGARVELEIPTTDDAAP